MMKSVLSEEIKNVVLESITETSEMIPVCYICVLYLHQH